MHLEPGKFYHIYNRGNNKENLFKESRNYSYFHDLWMKHTARVADTYAYCLLPNHFHYCVFIKEVSDVPNPIAYINKQFSNCFNAYSKAINKAYGRTGSLFQERFKRKELPEEEDVRRLICYVHTNPLKHGIARDFRNYPYSSFSSLPVRSDEIALKVMELFGGKDKYEKVHAAYAGADLTGFKNL